MSARALGIALGFAFLAAPAALAGGPFEVSVDQTSPLRLHGTAQSVIVGNAAIVDVTVHDAHTLLVTGKSFGSTNLVVLDHAGQTIYSSMIMVDDTTPDRLTITTAKGTNSYSCVSKCRSTIQVGDAPDYLNATLAAAQAASGAAKGN